jgi:ketosteroid isomerase-like protein
MTAAALASTASDNEHRTETLEDMYDAFNARDIDAALAHLAPDVDWPNAASGGRVHGREAVRAYWLAQWSKTNPAVKPLRIEFAADGTVHLRVDQLVRDLSGKILENRQVGHVYTFDGAFITRMRIVEAAPEDEDEE